ncbi:MAG: DNA/RNA nuclease SfsA, partial [Spongiibacteraceae bacterium]
SRVWLSHSDSPKRKYAYSWQLVENDGQLICVHSALANGVFAEALLAERPEVLAGYNEWRREVRLDSGSRIDFMLSAEGKADCYIEVKAVTLHQGAGLGAFPDTVSQRATKHLLELRALVEQGFHAQLAFVVLHNGITQVSAASDIDPVYASALADAERAGVVIKAYGVDVTTAHLQLTHPLIFAL